jgi:hypothetical protein
VAAYACSLDRIGRARTPTRPLRRQRDKSLQPTGWRRSPSLGYILERSLLVALRVTAHDAVSDDVRCDDNKEVNAKKQNEPGDASADAIREQHPGESSHLCRNHPGYERKGADPGLCQNAFKHHVPRNTKFRSRHPAFTGWPVLCLGRDLKGLPGQGHYWRRAHRARARVQAPSRSNGGALCVRDLTDATPAFEKSANAADGRHRRRAA